MHDHGGQLVVSPNANADVIRASKQLGLVSVPGVMTPTEAFAAMEAGADALKLFPAAALGPSYVKDIKVKKDLINTRSISNVPQHFHVRLCQAVLNTNFASVHEEVGRAPILIAVGGIDNGDVMREWVMAGADGLGVGSALFKPGDSVERVFTKVKRFLIDLEN